MVFLSLFRIRGQPTEEPPARSRAWEKTPAVAPPADDKSICSSGLPKSRNEIQMSAPRRPLRRNDAACQNPSVHEAPLLRLVVALVRLDRRLGGGLAIRLTQSNARRRSSARFCAFKKFSRPAEKNPPPFCRSACLAGRLDKIRSDPKTWQHSLPDFAPPVRPPPAQRGHTHLGS
jgi:hypothetical protein